jgi:hypothetical protein
VFPTTAFPTVIRDLQEAQARGRGAVARVHLTTVRNEYWGIDEGFSCNVTFVYLNRTPQWEVGTLLLELRVTDQSLRWLG